MIEVRAKDRIFVAVALPLAVAFMYLWQWRPQCERELADLRARDRATVTEVGHPSEKRIRLQRLKEAEAALAKLEALPPPAVEVSSPAGGASAERMRASVGVFREHSLRVLSIEGEAASHGAGASPAAGVLKATGACPAPERRVYRLEGAFPNLRMALRTIVSRKMAVVVESVASEGENRWRLAVYE
jgi:hypothetical protein